MDKDKIIETLAARLYWQMERLDPSLPEAPGWDQLTERQRIFYGLLVSDLLAHKEMIHRYYEL